MFLATGAFAQSDDIPRPQTTSPLQTPGFIEYAWQLVVWHKDGSKVLFSLDERPKITYTEEKVIVETSTSSMIEYDFQAIRKMTYSLEEVDGIREVKVRQEMPFTSSGGVITFLPAEEDLRVRIAKTNGMVLKDFVVRRGEASSIPLHPSQDKIYLVNVNGVTYKITMR